MPEREIHKQAKKVVCGCGPSVKVEQTLPTRQRLDCVNPIELSCGEVELTRSRIPYALNKLETAQRLINCRNPTLVVTPTDYAYARGIAPKQVRVTRLNHIRVGSCKKS